MQRLDDFMNTALTAYYNSRDPLGINGDFTTAPEISQLFGEIIGIWSVQKWMQMDSPSLFNLVEIGPGRGTLMNDLLRGTEHIKKFHDSMSIHMIETSATLKQKQKALLNNHNTQWHKHLSSVDNDIPTIIIANEFFDALPIRQFQFNGDYWLEHYIDSEKSRWIKTDNPPHKSTLPTPENNDVYEYSALQQQYAEMIADYDGAALIIDYGYEKSIFGDSLQALYKHNPCTIFDHIGDADLTSHIDFEWLSTFFKYTQVITQRQFLKENGIDIRYQSLNNPQLDSGYNRLIGHNQMGSLFKVLEITLRKF